jgi:hypothetical protein
MSLIGSIGHSLFSLFQSVGGGSGQTAQSTLASAAQTAANTTGTTSTTATTGTQGVQGSGHHHHHHHGGESSQAGGADSSQNGGIFGQIQSAVLSALQTSAQNSPAGGTPSDVDQTVQTAIENVLTGKGISEPAGSNASGETNAAGQPDSDGTGGGTSFIQTLEQYGVSPEQFRKDFMSAIQNLYGSGQSATGGSTASNLTAMAIPPGSLLDETA